MNDHQVERENTGYTHIEEGLLIEKVLIVQAAEY
jgi:hypothetical protein